METAVRVENLRKRYREKEVVRGISFTVQSGEIFGIVGPNGAGKTTTLEILEGLRRRDGGQVEILGLDPARRPYELRRRIGVQFQLTAIQERLLVGEALRLFAALHGRDGADGEAWTRSLGVEPILRKSFRSLSGGQRQRVSLALAVIHDPELVFLDEPSAGLDPSARRELWDLILALRGRGKTIVLTTHHMDEAERLCDRVAMLKDGRIACMDSPSRLVERFAPANRISLDSPDADPERLRWLPGVLRVSLGRDGRRFIHTSDRQETARRVFEAAREHGWTIRDFRFETGSLDDLFVSVDDSRGVTV